MFRDQRAIRKQKHRHEAGHPERRFLVACFVFSLKKGDRKVYLSDAKGCLLLLFAMQVYHTFGHGYYDTSLWQAREAGRGGRTWAGEGGGFTITQLAC